MFKTVASRVVANPWISSCHLVVRRLSNGELKAVLVTWPNSGVKLGCRHEFIGNAAQLLSWLSFFGVRVVR